MATNSTLRPSPDTSENDTESSSPPRLRLKLSTATDVVRELARLYRSGKSGEIPVADVSRLANVLQIIGRLIETSEVELRLEALEGKN
jgi:hypothetical protein